MRRCLSSLFVLLFLGAGLAWSELPLENPEVRRIGEKLACQCGCSYSLSSCQMNECSFAHSARIELLKMVQSGMTEKQILAAFQKQYGVKILLQPPAQGFFLLGWLMPFIGLVFGGGVVWIVLKRYLRPRPASATAAADSDTMSRYKDRIEKDLADLD
jgi:cytochrome c-type biogenesis protein CcmH